MIQSHYMIANAPRRQPLYVQIKQFLLRRIAEGEWLEHDALPSEWDLADEMSVSQGTVRKALTELVADGLLYRQQGKGTFVAPVLSDWVMPCCSHLVCLMNCRIGSVVSFWPSPG